MYNGEIEKQANVQFVPHESIQYYGILNVHPYL